MICAFTGYRPEKMPFIESKDDKAYCHFREMQTKVINRLIKRGVHEYISGVAEGFDLWAAEEICHIKESDNSIKLECAIPFPGQAHAWDRDSQERRYKVIAHANSSIILSESYNRDCYFKRNRYMVDKADVIVCAYDGKSGGTDYTVKYALKKDKIVIQINPTNAQVSIISNKVFV